MKATFVLFDTDYTAEIKNGNIKDGSVTINKKEYIVDQTKPIKLIKRTGGTRPLYLLKWNCLRPLNPEVAETVEKRMTNGLVGVEEVGKVYEGGKKEKPIPTAQEYSVRELTFLETKFKDGGDKVTPELLQTTLDLRFLKSMKKYAGGGGGFDIGDKLPLILFFVIIFALSFLMVIGWQGGWFGKV